MKNVAFLPNFYKPQRFFKSLLRHVDSINYQNLAFCSLYKTCSMINLHIIFFPEYHRVLRML